MKNENSTRTKPRTLTPFNELALYDRSSRKLSGGAAEAEREGRAWAVEVVVAAAWRISAD